MQTTNIIHFPGLPLFRLEYKFTQFILVPGPSSRWRWHHRHLAGPARSGRPGRSVSVRSVSVRSGPGGGVGAHPGRSGNHCASWCVLCAQSSQGGMQPRQPVWTRKVEIFSSGFISWLLFKVRFIFYHVEQLNTVLNSGRPGKGIVLKVRITCGTWRLIFVNLLSNLTKWKMRAKCNDDDPHALHQRSDPF
jgi:hypothetical protein